MSPRTNGFDGRYIVFADEDRAVVGLVIETLLKDGHAVFQAYDGLSAIQLALGLKVCDLVISNTRVGGVAGLELIHELRVQLPTLAIVYLANRGRSTADIERRSRPPPRPTGAIAPGRTAVDSRGPLPDSTARDRRVPGESAGPSGLMEGWAAGLGSGHLSLSGVGERRGPTRPAYDLSLTRHPWVRPIRRQPASREPIVLTDKGFAPIPHQEAGAVHWGVGEAPEGVPLVSDEIRRDQRVLVRPDRLATKGAVGASRRDLLHAEASPRG
jgi:CheY-like chemotaxis protein